jgi:acyl dehydratase
MPLNYDSLLNWKLPAVAQDYSARDSILYAIGVGASIGGIDNPELPLLYEADGPKTLPTMATVIGQRAMWMDDPALGMDIRMMVHGEQALTVHVPLPGEASIVSDEKVAAVYDKGAGRGALIEMERTIHSADRATLYATLITTYFLRGDGGFGGPDQPPSTQPPIPDRAADMVMQMPTRSDQSIIYRLSGDIMKLHIDRDFAQKAGFPGPIMHGLCTYGIAARAIVNGVCDHDPDWLESISGRFSAPAYPGETIQVEIWRIGERELVFRASVPERNAIVFNNGFATLRGSN